MKREDCEKGLYVSFLWEGVEKIGKVYQLGINDAWVNCLGITWLVPYDKLSKAPADKALEYIDKEDKVVRVSSVEGGNQKRSFCPAMKSQNVDTDLSGITFDILAVRKCPEGNFVSIVYQDINGKVDVVFLRVGDYTRILSEDFQDLYNYRKIKEYGI